MNWADRSYPELEPDADSPNRVAILPLGAVEAHGPHLPVGTDVWIAEAMARAGRNRLAEEGVPALVLPAIAYAAAPFADGFGGTLSIRPETTRALLLDLAAAVTRRGVAVLALANAHFDPANVAVLRSTVDAVDGAGGLRVVFPDCTRRTLAGRLGDEFRTGACHAGRYESSILLAERPDLVREKERRALRERPVSLVEASRLGQTSFADAGLDEAYCGDPAAATAAEGREIVAELGKILAEAVRAALM
ncbi:MAG: creatininase family protein [Thermoanaerobaculia bacterium]